jgi:hypothetical protein
MSTLWGTGGSSKQGDTEEHEHENEPTRPGTSSHGHTDSSTRDFQERESSFTTNMREPMERDRLLADNRRPPHPDGFLDPDDPAVSRVLSHQSHPPTQALQLADPHPGFAV